jgi:tRNA(Ile)-lysidine synthase
MMKKANQTIQWIQKQIKEDECVIVALSGGPDSALLLELTCMAAAEGGFPVLAAHLNHGLRDEANQEEESLRIFCQARKIPFYSKRVACAAFAAEHHLTLEEAGRNLRYDFFASIRKENPGWILTGHHRNDQVETILFHLFRGTGARGLRGIPAIDPPVLRPLHEWKREEILAACREKNIAYFIDKSNESTVYTRNWIRHELIPLLENRFDQGVVDRIVHTSELIAQDDDYLQSMAKQAFTQAAVFEADGIALNRELLKTMELPILSRVLFLALEKQYGSRKDVSSSQIQQAVKLIRQGQAGNQFQFSMNRGFLIGSQAIYWGVGEKEQSFSISLCIPGETRVPGGIVYAEWEKNEEEASDPFTIEIDYDKIKSRLFWRTKQSGDWFFLPRKQGRKKLKRFWIDEKIPQHQRVSWPLLAVDDQILWIAGQRKCVERPKAGARVLRIRWRRFEGGHHEEGY